MTSPPDVSRRISRVENDVTALYDLIGDVQAVQGRHSADLARIRTKLLEHDTGLDPVDTNLTEILRRPEAS